MLIKVDWHLIRIFSFFPPLTFVNIRKDEISLINSLRWFVRFVKSKDEVFVYLLGNPMAEEKKKSNDANRQRIYASFYRWDRKRRRKSSNQLAFLCVINDYVNHAHQIDTNWDAKKILPYYSNTMTAWWKMLEKKTIIINICDWELPGARFRVWRMYFREVIVIKRRGRKESAEQTNTVDDFLSLSVCFSFPPLYSVLMT